MGNPTYKCPISINVDYNILRKYAFYYVYIRENKKSKEAFEKYFGISDRIKTLKKFHKNFNEFFSRHLDECGFCYKEFFKSILEDIKPYVYICSMDNRFNHETICSFLLYEKDNYGKDKIIEIFGEEYKELIKKHFIEHKECMSVYERENKYLDYDTKEYECDVDSRINSRNFRMFMLYNSEKLKSKTKVDIKELEKTFIRIFGKDFSSYLSLHILNCPYCKKVVDSFKI